jgi:superfamily II DNA or RNA helicase
VQKANLINLLDGVSVWSELEARIASLPSEQERGGAFEQFCKIFFLLDPVFQFKEVYCQREIPPSIFEQLGYPGRQDIGIDGVAVTIDGKLFAYQAKFRSDRGSTPTLKELSTFFTVSDRADWRITITNANSLPSAINDRTKQSRILADRLDQLEPNFFTRLRCYLQEQIVVLPAIKKPHKTQQEAIDAALKYFKKYNSGQLILPCGTGKTLAAMWIAEKIGAKRILVMLPSLALISQTLREWAANTSIKPFRYLCLCSDTTVDLGNDAPIEHLYEMDIPVTTDVERVAGFLTDNRFAISVFFSTYQSGKVLSEAALKTGTVFDIAILDEAHRTTGTDVGVWSMALKDEKVPVKNRIFMTATPRIYSPHITKRAKEEDVLVCSMDDPSVYGKPFYEMTFGGAIERGHITDYKIVVICVTDSEVKEIIQRGGRVIIDDDREWDAKAFAKRVALVKGMNGYGLKKVFTFHSKIKGAKAFTDTKTPYGIHEVFKMLEPENDHKKEVKFFHVNGTMSSGVRNSIMKEFKEAEIGIMSNARCLTEGVDVPTVDTVAFIDPKKSLIDIVQATGRAMRKAEWKEKGYIFIPVVVGEDADSESIIENSDFDAVWQVLQAMVDQDHRLEDTVSNLRVMQGKGEEGTQTWKAAMAEYAEKVEFYNLPTNIDRARFINTLHTKTVEVIGRSWDFWFGELLKYKQKFGHCNVPQRWFVNPQLAKWVQHQRALGKKGRLSEDRFKRLDTIGFTWDRLDDAWEKMFAELENYKQIYGHCNVPLRWPENRKLGIWVSSQRAAKKHGELDKEYVERLNRLGFVWNVPKEIWEELFNELINFKKVNGHCNVPAACPQNQPLGTWVNNLRNARKRGILRVDYIERLNKIGFVWDPYDEQWERMFAALNKYKSIYGNCNVPYRWPENRQLGIWVSRQRRAKKSGKLDAECIERLAQLGFLWDISETSWEDMFAALVEYKNTFGHCNVPNRWDNNPKLGKWVHNQRQSKKRGELSKGCIRKLNELGFVWNILDENWNEMFSHLAEYKNRHGNCDVPKKWKDNPKLANWVCKQRFDRKNRNLSDERIRKLNKIGFSWEPHEAQWNNMYNALIEFKIKNSHCDVPQKNSTTPKLGIWVANCRKSYKKGKLSPEKIKKLEEIGFKWKR